MRSKLDELRKEVDECDQQIIEWLCQRREIVEEISIWKQHNHIDRLDENREALILGKYYRDFDSDAIDLVRAILKVCR